MLVLAAMIALVLSMGFASYTATTSEQDCRHMES